MTDDEKHLVARRAAGEYSVLDSCRRIWHAYRRKERSVYTAFLQVIFSKSDGRVSLADWDEYEKAARAVLALYPEFGVCAEPELKETPEPELEPEPEEKVPELEHVPQRGQLKRCQILEALRRPWPTRGIESSE